MFNIFLVLHLLILYKSKFHLSQILNHFYLQKLIVFPDTAQNYKTVIILRKELNNGSTPTHDHLNRSTSIILMTTRGFNI